MSWFAYGCSQAVSEQCHGVPVAVVRQCLNSVMVCQWRGCTRPPRQPGPQCGVVDGLCVVLDYMASTAGGSDRWPTPALWCLFITQPAPLLHSARHNRPEDVSNYRNDLPCCECPSNAPCRVCACWMECPCPPENPHMRHSTFQQNIAFQELD